MFLLLLPACLPLKPTPDSGVPDHPVVQVSTSTLDFGAVAIGGSSERPLAISNIGEGELNVVLTTPWDSPFTVQPDRFTLGLGEIVEVAVLALPEEEGLYEASLLVNSDDPDDPVVEVAMHLEAFTDNDSDGWALDLDCDDEDATRHPGAEELADGVDQDCDGVVDRLTIGVAPYLVRGDQPGAGLGGTVWLLSQPDLGGLLLGWPDANEQTGALLALSAAELSHAPEAASASVQQPGEAALELAGTALVTVSDADGDGWTELALGAPGASSSRGVVRFLDLSGAYTSGGSTAQGKIEGVSVYARTGQALASGDWDGDGLPDLLIGAPGDANSRGRVYGFLGDDAYISNVQTADRAAARIRGELQDDALGQTLTLGPDLSGDGYGDAVVCASGPGACWLLEGSAAPRIDNLSVGTVSAASWTGDGAGDGFGGALSAGDYDADGRSDLAIGAPGVGAVYVYWGGALSGSLHTHDADEVMSAEGEAGTALGSTPWEDGDALLIGAPGQDEGHLFMVLPPMSLSTGALMDEADVVWTGERSGDRLGAAVHAGVDIDGDALGEIAAGAPGAAEGLGRVYVLKGGE